MQTYRLVVVRVSSDSQGDLLERTHTVRAESRTDAERRSTVVRVVDSMDNVIDWNAHVVDE